MLRCLKRVVIFTFNKIVYFVYLLYKWKIEYDLGKQLDKGLIKNKKNTINIGDVTYTEYAIVNNKNIIDVVIVNDFTESDHGYLKFLENRNMIVHANISKGDNILLDITKDFRKFSFYFESELSFDIFLQYLDKMLCKGYSFDVNDCDIILYLNDIEFTECKYEMKQARQKSFYELTTNTKIKM